MLRAKPDLIQLQRFKPIFHNRPAGFQRIALTAERFINMISQLSVRQPRLSNQHTVRAAFQRPQSALGKAVLVFPVFLAFVPVGESSVGIINGCRFQRIVLGKFADDETVGFSDEPRESQVAADDAFQKCFIGVFGVCNKVKAR